MRVELLPDPWSGIDRLLLSANNSMHAIVTRHYSDQPYRTDQGFLVSPCPITIKYFWEKALGINSKLHPFFYGLWI